jgi:DNA repair exonuclease SbcCD ATPase subunit
VAIDSPLLKRSLFGLSPRSVRALLDDRDRVLARVSQEATDGRTQLRETTEQLEAARRDAATKDELASEAIAQIQHLDQELSAARQQLAVQTELARGREDRLAEIERELESRQRAAELMEEQAERAEGARAELADRVQEITEGLSAKEGEIDQARRRAQHAEEALQAARNDTATERATVEELRARVAELTEQLAERADRVRTEIAGQVEELTEGLSAKEREIDQLRHRTRETEEALLAARNDTATERATVEELSARVAELTEQLAERPVEPAEPPEPLVVGASASDEIGAAISAAEQAMERILETGRRRAADEVHALERRSTEVRLEIEHLEELRTHMDDAMREVRTAAEDARSRITVVEEQLHHSLDPLALSLMSLGSQLVRLSEASTPTDVIVPETEDHDERTSGSDRPPSPWQPGVGRW